MLIPGKNYINKFYLWIIELFQMKHIILSLSIALLSNICFGQFQGILHYDCTLKNQVLMTIYLAQKDVSVQNMGSEKIGSFSCDHYILTIKGSKKDLWITKDLGTSGLYVGSEFLYYATGGLVYQKLASVGANGIVVKSQNGTLKTELTNYEKKEIPAAMFQIPPGFQTIDRSMKMKGN
jgi:Domain of unknown function (DUF4412)